MKVYEVVTVGSALKDIMFYSEDVFVVSNKKDIKQPELLAMEYGAKIPIHEVFVNYGGGALNVAVGLKNFGIYVAPLICLGKDQVGREVVSYLKKKRIDSSLIKVARKQRTGFSIIITAEKDKEHTIFTYKGASSYLSVPRRGFRTKWFYVSALSNQNWQQEFDKITQYVRRGSRIAWNPGSLQLKHHRALINFLPAVEVLILNKDEAIELVSRSSKKIKKVQLNNVKFLLKQIKSFGPQKVVITQGSKGITALDENKQYYYLPAKSIVSRIVDTVGAGDSFSSGFLAGLIRFEKISPALALGIKNSAKVLYEAGAQNGLLKEKL